MSEYTITANTSSAELVSILSSLEDDDIVNVDCPEFPRTFTNEITIPFKLKVFSGSTLYYKSIPYTCKGQGFVEYTFNGYYEIIGEIPEGV